MELVLDCLSLRSCRALLFPKSCKSSEGSRDHVLPFKHIGGQRGMKSRFFLVFEALNDHSYFQSVSLDVHCFRLETGSKQCPWYHRLVLQSTQSVFLYNFYPDMPQTCLPYSVPFLGTSKQQQLTPGSASVETSLAFHFQHQTSQTLTSVLLHIHPAHCKASFSPLDQLRFLSIRYPTVTLPHQR